MARPTANWPLRGHGRFTPDGAECFSGTTMPHAGPSPPQAGSSARRLLTPFARLDLILPEGQSVKVKFIGFDERGKVRLSMKAVDQTTGQEDQGRRCDGRRAYDLTRPSRSGGSTPFSFPRRACPAPLQQRHRRVLSSTELQAIVAKAISRSPGRGCEPRLPQKTRSSADGRGQQPSAASDRRGFAQLPRPMCRGARRAQRRPGRACCASAAKLAACRVAHPRSLVANRRIGLASRDARPFHSLSPLDKRLASNRANPLEDAAPNDQVGGRGIAHGDVTPLAGD